KFKDEKFDWRSRDDQLDVIYDSCLDQVRSVINTPNFDQKHIIDFIHATSNNDFDKVSNELNGLFSGVLLQVLTEHYHKENAKASFCFDGDNIKFDCLFYRCRCVDELLIENFQGDFVGNKIGSSGGKVNILVGKNIKGYQSLAGAGRKGNAGLVFGEDLTGGICLNGCGFIGNVDIVVGYKIRGDGVMQAIGSGKDDVKGRTDLVIAHDIDCKSDLFVYSAEAGLINNIFVGKISDCYASVETREDYYKMGSLGYVRPKPKAVGTIYCEKKDASFLTYLSARQYFSRGGYREKEYYDFVKSRNINNSLDLLESKPSTSEDLLNKARKIKQLYENATN
ncbi:hypothetical protein HON01_04330, partial [Candidatus Woesearchaeota archaeon]|nr:hypothetical protein [Candidatus Woesearchaeota archaeon]